MNTFGFCSINTGTFNLNSNTNYTYPKQARDLLITFLKVHNLTLNILGYIPGISSVSGGVRIGTGLAMCAITFVGEPNAEQQGVNQWCDEALITGISQIARGVLEVLASDLVGELFLPGWVTLLSLDIIATVPNLLIEFSAYVSRIKDANYRPHPNPEYPFPFWLLHLV